MVLLKMQSEASTCNSLGTTLEERPVLCDVNLKIVGLAVRELEDSITRDFSNMKKDEHLLGKMYARSRARSLEGKRVRVILLA